MNINSAHKKHHRPSSFLLIGGLLLAIVTLLAADYLRHRETANLTATGIYCNAESMQGDFFINDKNIQFSGADVQSTAQARSGSHSMRLSAKKRTVGFEYQLENPAPGNRYRVKVWRYATAAHQGYVAVQGVRDSTEVFLQKEGTAIEEKEGWELLQITFDIPNEKLSAVKVFAMIDDNNGDVFFDDFQLLNLERVEIENVEIFAPDELNIELSDKAYSKLNSQKWQGYKDGILMIPEAERWVKADLTSKQQDAEMPVKLRLKGDWLDHVSGNKWSFRIKTKSAQTWNRLVTFSIQHPKTRSYLEEWLYHQLLRQEQVLTPRYDFIKVNLNGESRGVYAYEEHFEKQLPEAQKRREGPILKLTEDLMWMTFQREYTYLKKGDKLPDKETNAFQQSDIRPFKESKTQANKTLAQQYEVAQSLLYQLKHQQATAADIFDVEKLAKYYAITDLMYAYHGLTWHNQRFYFNPIINKLEPIGFDGFGDHKTNYGAGPFIGYKVKRETHPARFFTYLFEDESFFTTYLSYLHQYTDPTFLQEFLLNIDPALRERERFLQTEFAEYNFDTEKIKRRARELRTLLKPHEEHSLHARLQDKKSKEWELKIANRHALPLQVVGYGKSDDQPTENLAQPLFTFANATGDIPVWYDLKIPADQEVIYYKLPGDATLYSSIIVDWKAPVTLTKPQKEFVFKPLINNDLYEITQQQVLFKKGMHTLTEDVLIPAGYTVHFSPGTQINMIDKAAFISKSPVYLLGDADAPIRIYSSDGTANGFTVLQADQKSAMQYVQFDNLNTLNKHDWTLTGAVTFYESAVDIAHCSFMRNNCEDGLNLVRSDFNLLRSRIAETFSDGFDADFCKGTLQDVSFADTGNDAIDFSTSVIDIKSVNIQNAGDKGISVGEAATVYVQQAMIDGAVIGVASKDLSKLTIDNIYLKNCQQGFTAYQKKPEFGAASIKVSDFKAEGLDHLYQLDRGSRLELKNKIYEGE